MERLPLSERRKRERAAAAASSSNLAQEPTIEPIPLPEQTPDYFEGQEPITFISTTYQLPNGNYKGDLIEVKEYLSNGNRRLLLVFDLYNGVQFLYSLAIPINIATTVGKALHQYRNPDNTLNLDRLLYSCTTFTVDNVEHNSKTYCNITSLNLTLQNPADEEGQ